MAGGEAGALEFIEIDACVIHAEGREDATAEERFVANGGSANEGAGEEGDAEVGVFVEFAGVAGELVGGEERHGLRVGIAGVGEGGIFVGAGWGEVERQVGEAGGMSGEVEQGDLFAAVRRDIGQVHGDGVGEGDFAVGDHGLEDEGGEGAGEGAEFEDGVGFGGSGGDGAFALGVEDGGDEGDGLFLFEALVEDGLDLVAGGGRGDELGGEERGEGKEDAG